MSKRQKDPQPNGNQSAAADHPVRKVSGEVELEIDLLRRIKTATSFPPVAADVNRANVLVVDDDTDMRRYVRRSLQRMELPIGQVFEAEDAAAALAVFATDRIDVMITDLVLGGMDGLELTRAVCADPATADVAVLLMTGEASYRETAPRARAAGARALLVKPFNAGKLRDAVAPLIPLQAPDGAPC